MIDIFTLNIRILYRIDQLPELTAHDIWEYVYIYIRIYIYIYIYAHICAYIYIYIYIKWSLL